MAVTAAVEVGEAQARLLEVGGRLAGEGERVGEAGGVDKTFRPYDPDQLLLLSPSLQDWVADGHLARFVSDLVDEGLDLSAVYAAYEEECGFPPYAPRLMLKLLLYGYATGTPSSRKLEQRSYDDVACRFLCADQHPDYRSIARFRRRHLEALSELFTQALALCVKSGLVKLGRVARDGTKLRANASRHRAMSYERMEREEARLEAGLAELRAQAKALFEAAELADEGEDARYGPDRRGDELPAELARREQRLRTIRQAQVIVAAELSNEAPDAPALAPVVAQLEENIARAAPELSLEGTQLLADAGFYSEANAETCRQARLDPFIATGRLKHSETPSPAPRGRIPKSATAKERMARKLRLRAHPAARAEWRPHCACHNLLKLFRAGGLALLEREARDSQTPTANRLGPAALLRAVRARLSAARLSPA